MAELATSALALMGSIADSSKAVAVQPSAAAMERFNAIMTADSVPHPAASSTAAVTSPQVSAAASSSGAETLGNQILTALQSASSGYTKTWQDTKARLESVARNESVVDMLRLQSDMLRLSVEYEMVGKLVARSTQNVDTLVRMS